MKRLVVASLLFALPALAQENKPADDASLGWTQSKLTNEKQAKKEIEALFREHHADVDAAAAIVDFPVIVVSDDSTGTVHTEQWTREKWVQMMTPFFQAPKDAKPQKDAKPPTVKHEITVLTDSIATVITHWSTTVGKNTISSRANRIVIKKDGKWLVKAEIEGGWGNAMKSNAQTSAPASQP